MPYGLLIRNAISAYDGIPLAAVADRLLDTLKAFTSSRAPGPFELASGVLEFLTEIDGFVRGRASTVAQPFWPVLMEMDGGASLVRRLQRHGLEPNVLLPFVPHHTRAVEEWNRGAEAVEASSLHALREHLAGAIAAGRFPLAPNIANAVVEALRSSPPSLLSDALSRMVHTPRSTSRDVVLWEREGQRQSALASNSKHRVMVHAARRMCRLPQVDRYFQGRVRLLDQLAPLAYTGPVIWLSGSPGAGTSSVAIHLAHRLAPQFDDIFYVDMFGMEVEARRTSRTAATMLLEAFDRSSTYRDDEALYLALAEEMCRRRSLLVLDNVRDAAHVRPLILALDAIPAIVASRHRQQDLTSVAIHVPVLEREDSLALLCRFASAPVDMHALARIAELCDDLPLALRLVSSRLTRQDLSTADLVRLLEAEHTRLDYLEVGERAVRSSVLLSYSDLAPNAARVTRYLACSYSAAVTAAMIACGMDQDEGATSVALHRAVDASLCEHLAVPFGQPQFKLPTLVRLVAAECAEKEDAPEDLARYRRRLVQLFADALRESTDRTSTSLGTELVGAR